MVSISELLALERLKVKTHEHVLIRNYNDNGWGCDGRKLAGCARGCTGFKQSAGWPRFRCELCDFDFCDECALRDFDRSFVVLDEASQARAAQDRAEVKARVAQDRAETKARVAQDRAETKARVAQDRAVTKARVAQDRAETQARVAQDIAVTKARVAQDRAEIKARVAQERAEVKARVAQDRAEIKARAAQDRAGATIMQQYTSPRISPAVQCPGNHTLDDNVTPSLGRRCDLCRNIIPIGIRAMSCRLCNFDACPACFEIPVKGTTPGISPAVHCPGNHTLYQNATPSLGRCDLCRKHMPQGFRALSCRLCNFDACPECFEIPAQATSPGISPAVHCPGNHALYQNATPNLGHCDLCRKRIPKGSRALSCRLCNFDACPACFEIPVISKPTLSRTNSPKPTTPVRVNADGAPVSLSFDGAHSKTIRSYCGRRVGQEGYLNPCQACDGRCGPTNGCQCRACYALDSFAIPKPPIHAQTVLNPLHL